MWFVFAFPFFLILCSTELLSYMLFLLAVQFADRHALVSPRGSEMVFARKDASQDCFTWRLRPQVKAATTISVARSNSTRTRFRGDSFAICGSTFGVLYFADVVAQSYRIFLPCSSSSFTSHDYVHGYFKSRLQRSNEDLKHVWFCVHMSVHFGGSTIVVFACIGCSTNM